MVFWQPFEIWQVYNYAFFFINQGSYRQFTPVCFASRRWQFFHVLYCTEILCI